MRQRTRLLLSLASVMLLICPAARADEPGKRAKVEQLFVLTRVDAMMGQMVEQMFTAMKASAEEQTGKSHLTPEQQVYASRFTAKVDGIIRQSLSMDVLKPVFLKVYMDTYTEDELDGIIAFYRSPAGQAFVSKTPQLMQRSIQFMQAQVAEVQPQIEEAQKQLSAEMMKSEAAAPGSAKP